MDKILIVEDNEKKIEKLRDFLKKDFPEIDVEEKRSYNSALKEIAINYDSYDLILLDMSHIYLQLLDSRFSIQRWC